MKNKLENLLFSDANDLIVEIFTNDKMLYKTIGKKILTVRNLNYMLQEVTDPVIKQLMLSQRKELINEILRNYQPQK